MNESVNVFLIHFNPDKIEHNTLQSHADFLRRSEVYGTFQQLSDQNLSHEEIHRINKRLSDFWKNCAALLMINATSLEILSIFIVYYHKQHEFLINFHLDFSAQIFMPAWCNRWLAMNWDENLRESTACLYHYGRMTKHYSTLLYDKNNLRQLLSPKITTLLLCINQQGLNYNSLTLGNIEQYISNVYVSIGQLAVLGCPILLHDAVVKEALRLLIYYTNYSNKSSQALSSFILALGYMARYNCGIIFGSAAIRASLDMFFNSVRYSDKSVLEIANIVLGVGYLAKNGNVFLLYDKINLALYTLCVHLTKLKKRLNYSVHVERAISIFYTGMRYSIERGTVFQLVSKHVDHSLMIAVKLKKVNLRMLIGCLLTLVLFIKKNQPLELHYLPQVMEKILPHIAELGIIDMQHLNLFLTTVSRYMLPSQIGVNASFIDELNTQLNNCAALGQPLNVTRLMGLAVIPSHSEAKREIKFDINSRVFIPQSALISQQLSVPQQLNSLVSTEANNTREICLQKDVVDDVRNADCETTVAPPLLVPKDSVDRNISADLQAQDSHGSDKNESGSQTSSEILNGNVKVDNESTPSEEGFGDDIEGDVQYADEKSDDYLKIDAYILANSLVDNDCTHHGCEINGLDTSPNDNAFKITNNSEGDEGDNKEVIHTVDSLVPIKKSKNRSKKGRARDQLQNDFYQQQTPSEKVNKSMFSNYGGLLWRFFTSCCPLADVESEYEAPEQIKLISNKVKIL